MDPLQNFMNEPESRTKQNYSSLVDGAQISPASADEVRRKMSSWIQMSFPTEGKEPLKEAPIKEVPSNSLSNAASSVASALTTAPAVGSSLSAILPSLIRMTQEISEELTRMPHSLLQLNPSRREALVQYLYRLAGISAPAATPADTLLRSWIEGPQSPAQRDALRAFRDEAALICLGQAILLKAWSDRGVRKWSQKDLTHLNWALGNALRPMIPLNREGWQITRPNLYSWYTPSPRVQHDIWELLSSWNTEGEGPTTLATAMSVCRRSTPENLEPRGYDARFFSTLWSKLGTFGIDPYVDPPGTIPRKWTFFCPTLRDGTAVRTAPQGIQWVGSESSAFRLLVSELAQLWWGPAPPPLWSQGNGLDAHTREQLAMEWNSPKPSLVSRIAEMEACDFSLVLEERSVRGSSKSIEAQAFRIQSEVLPYFKKLREHETSLGCLQACVALTKLRSRGLLLWAREEPLGANEGKEALHFLMDRARLLASWDLSNINHSLPTQNPLFPRHLYLFERDNDVERRRSYRPCTIRLDGQIRSHIEVPLFQNDIWSSYHENPASRGSWEVLKHVHPTPQQEWPEHWPESGTSDAILKMERLRERSVPLGQLATVRPWSPTHRQDKGFWLTQMSGPTLVVSVDPSEERKLWVADPSRVEPLKEAAFQVVLPSEAWLAPIQAYLESEIVTQWLDSHAERRNQRWHLKDSVIRFIPVPKMIADLVQAEPSALEAAAGSYFGLLREVDHRPDAVKLRLQEVLQRESSRNLQGLFSAIFVRAAQCRSSLLKTQSKLLSLMRQEGELCSKQFISVLPQSELISFTRHPEVRLMGAMPPHLPIDRIQKVTAPAPAILFATHAGLNIQVKVDQPFLLDLLWGQVQGLSNVTWSELTKSIFLPKNSELAKTTASDVMSSHAEESRRCNEYQALIQVCLKE